MPDDEETSMSAERKRILWPLSGRWLVFAISLIFAASCPLVVRAQNPPPNVQYTNKAVDLGLRGNLTVNPSTRALEIQIPLGGFAGRAGFNVPIAISYSSKVHRIKYEGYNPGHYTSSGVPIGDGYTLVSDRFAEYSSAGWTSSVGFPVQDYSATGEPYDMFGMAVGSGGQCPGYPCLTVDRLLFRMPDGSTHELRSTDQPRFPNDPLLDNYYSVDGSRMRYQSSTQTLFLADGSRYILDANPKYIDRNGNTITNTDTLGRAISNPLAGTGDYAYSVPGVGGSAVNYTFKWRYLDDPGVLTLPQPLQYIANSSCPLGNGSYSPNLFMGDSQTCIVNGGSIFRPVVLYQIVLPTGQAYTFTYNIYGEIDKVVLPTGGYERYEYAQVAPLTTDMKPPYLQGNRGITRRYVSASGLAADEVSWQYSGGGGSVSITAPDGSLTTLSMYTDVSLSTTFGYSPDQARAGRAFAENFYSPPDGTGARQLLRRHLSEWSVTGSNATSQFSAAQTATRNARLTKEVEIIFDTGGGALARTTAREYDLTYQFSTGVNETATNECDYVVLDQTTAQTIAIGSVPTGSLLRRTEKTYLDATNQAYRDRNLLGLVSSSTVKDGAGNVLAQSSFGYDESSLFTYGSVTNWTDPGTSVRGNATSKSNWLNFNGSTMSTFPAGTYVVTQAQYDQCGSVRVATDAKGNQSQVAYLDAFSDGVPRNTYAYPTSVTTAVPDPSGTYGSNAAFVTTSVYDFNTGRSMSTTDANNQTTSFAYNDPFNRLKTVTLPDGGATTYNYSDTPGSLYVETLTKEDSTRSIDAYQFFDGLGRPNRGFLNIGNGNYNTTDTQYDNMGRVSRVSNPYVSTGSASPINPSGYWTTSAYDALGRVLSVTTPDGAVVTTAYAGSTGGTLGMTVLVTDQAGKTRRSLTDALGRLVRVDEPDANGSLDSGGTPVQPTSYAYDLLGNLRQVTQGSQQRFFMYDSLSRLIRALNPEQTANPLLNLTDSNTNNSQWVFAYSYDVNGNLLARTDARGVMATYTYDALNRNTSVTYTSDPAGTPAVSRYYDGWRGGIYSSSIGNSKGRLWQTETSGSTGTRTTIDGYDLVGRPAQQEQQFKTTSGWSSAYITSHTYDLGGHVTLQTYPSGHAVAYNYDIAGRLADKDASHLAFSGNLGDGANRTYATGISYDSASRLTLEQYGTTTPIYGKMAYNSRGQLAEIRAGTASVDDNRGKFINWYSTQCGGASCNNSDNNGNLMKQEMFIPSNEQNTNPTTWYQQYSYDKLNRLTQAHETTGNTSFDWQQQFVYDRYGNRTIDQTNTWGANIPKPNFGVNTATNQLTPPSGTMTYDPGGNLSNDTYSGQGQRTYDAENRMTQAWSNGQWQTYIYDGDGKRVKRIVNGIETWQVYGLGGELLAEYAANAPYTNPQKEYGYRSGQLLVTSTITSGWGAAPVLHDNPLNPNYPGETTVQARHITELRDAINALRSHLNMSPYSWQYSVTTSDWITANPILEMRTALDQALGAPSGGYAAGLAQGFPIKAIHIQELRDRVLAAWTTGSSAQTNWLVTDQLGTPRMIFDQTGSLANVSRHDYLPFGEEISAGVGGRTQAQGYTLSDNVRQKFTQKDRDNETGLDYFIARYYSSTQGRFTSSDPIGGHTEDPQTLDRYTYVTNNPLRFTDPTGLDFYLTCEKDSKTCHGGHVGTTDKKGNFTATLISNGKNGSLVDQSGNRYTATVNGQGVSFTRSGSNQATLGVFQNGTSATTIQGSGNLSGFTFNFTSSNLNTNITAQGTWTFNGPTAQAERTLEAAGYTHYTLDGLNVFHPSTETYDAVDYRSAGAEDTGAGSGHFTVHEPVTHTYIPARGGPGRTRIPGTSARISARDTVPTTGDVHFGEHNPFTGGIGEHMKEVKRSIWP